MSIFEFLRSDGFIAVNKKFARAIGLSPAIIYSELISRHLYFRDNGRLTDDNYFYNTIGNLEDATTIGASGQRSAIKKLVELGLIEMKVRGLPAKRYFRIIDNDELLLRIIDSNNEEPRNDYMQHPKRQTSHSIVEQLDTVQSSTNNTNINKTNIKYIYSEPVGEQVDETDVARKVLEYWNDKKIITHRDFSEALKSRINSKLKTYSYEEICKAIDNYSVVLNGEEYFFDYKWTLGEFLTREHGLVKFLDENLPLKNYLKAKSDINKQTYYKPTKIEFTQEQEDIYSKPNPKLMHKRE